MSFQRIVIADCLEYHQTMPSAFVDLVHTDPPYNISTGGKVSKDHGKIVNTDFGDWDKFAEGEYDAFIELVFREYMRILKQGGSAYVWLDRAYVGVAWRIAKRCGLTPKNIIAVVKRNPVPGIMSRNNWRSGYEAVLYMTKGKANTFNFIAQEKMVNVMYYCIGKHETDHPTEKPLDIVKHFVEVSSNKGDLVLDSFAGSGVTLEACRMTDRCCIGIEKDAIWKEVIEKKALLKQPTLTADKFWVSDVDSDSVQTTIAFEREPEKGAKRTQQLSLNEILWKRRRR